MKIPTDKEPVVFLQGDCLQILPEVPGAIVDAVITDPPYSSGGMTIVQRTASAAKKYVQSGSARFASADFVGDNRDQRSWHYWCHLWLSMCLRSTKPGGYVLMFSDWRQLPTATDVMQAAGWTWRGIIAWDKGLAARAPSPKYFRHQCEYIVWGTRGALDRGTDYPAKGEGCFSGAYSYPVLQSDKFHMVGKPTQLMRQLIQCVRPGGLILDPFGGSGTTAVAAKREGRRCISIEFLEEYVNVGKGRIADEGAVA